MKRAAVVAVAVLTALVLTYLFRFRERASIGIIGGADGPTAIFVTSSPGFPWWLIFVVIVVIVAAVVLIMKNRK